MNIATKNHIARAGAEAQPSFCWALWQEQPGRNAEDGLDL